MNSVEFLDAVRTKYGLDSDNKLSAHLHINRTRISAFRNGRRKLDADACLAVARALELPPEHVFASVAAERAKRTEHRRIWQRLAKAAKELPLVCVVAFAGSTSAPTSSHAAEASAQQCIFCKTRRIARDRDRRRYRRRFRVAAMIHRRGARRSRWNATASRTRDRARSHRASAGALSASA